MPDVGELVPLGVAIRDPAGNPINAAQITLTIRRPDLTTVDTPVVVNPPANTGQYAVDYIPTAPGRYLYRWAAVDPALVLEGTFDVLPTGSVGVISVARAKRALRIPETEHDEDEDVAATILAATSLAENERHEIIAPRVMSETRRLRQPTSAVALTHRPVISMVEVTRVGSGGVALSSIVPPAVWVDEQGICRLAGWMRGVLQFRYTAGYQIIPPEYQQAVEIIVQHLWGLRSGSTRRPRAGGSRAEEDTGSDDASGYALPNRARDLLGNAGPLVG